MCIIGVHSFSVHKIVYNILHPFLIHICHFQFQFYTASGKYIGEISKMAPISHLKHTGHLAIHGP